MPEGGGDGSLAQRDADPLISAAEGAAFLLLSAMAAYDYSHHRVPNALVVVFGGIAVAGQMAGRWDLSWWGLFAGLLLAIVADVPGGDLKALLLVGALAGSLATVWTFALAATVTLTVWGTTERRAWPWLPLVLACYVLVSLARRLL